jgi:hypothetical protein
MSVHLKTPEEVENMRIAGRLASEVLDFVTAHVKAGVTTDELDALCLQLGRRARGVALLLAAGQRLEVGQCERPPNLWVAGAGLDRVERLAMCRRHRVDSR